MNTLADILGLPDELRIPSEYTDKDGKVYKMSELTLEGRGLFTRWLERRAREEAVRGSEDLPTEEAKERYIGAITKQITVGTFEFGGEASYNALRQPAGRKYAVYLGLLENHPEMTEEKAEELLEKKMLEIGMILRQKIEVEQDPKVLAALGLTPVNSVEPRLPLRTTRTTGKYKKSKNSRRRK